MKLLRRKSRRNLDGEAAAVPEGSPISLKGTLLDEYDVGLAHILITEEDGRARYIVKEPELDEKESRALSMVVESLYYYLRPTPEVQEQTAQIENYIWEAGEELGILEEVKRSYQKLRYYVLRDSFLGYGMIDAAVRDSLVKQIACEGASNEVSLTHANYTEYGWIDTELRFASEFELRSFVNRLAHKAGRTMNLVTPYLDATTRDGHRIALTLSSEVTPSGSSFTVKKAIAEPPSLPRLVGSGTIPSALVAYYWMLLEKRAFVLVTGPKQSGKTTVLNALASLIPREMKVVSIEETPELVLPHRHWQRFVTRRYTSSRRLEIGAEELTSFSFAFEPDYIVIGDISQEKGLKIANDAASRGYGCLLAMNRNEGDGLPGLAGFDLQPFQLTGVWSTLALGWAKENRKVDGQMKESFVRRVVGSSEFPVRSSSPGVTELLAGLERPLTVQMIADLTSRLTDSSLETVPLAEELRRRAELIEKLVRTNKLSLTDCNEAIHSYSKAPPPTSEIIPQEVLGEVTGGGVTG